MFDFKFLAFVSNQALALKFLWFQYNNHHNNKRQLEAIVKKDNNKITFRYLYFYFPFSTIVEFHRLTIDIAVAGISVPRDFIHIT